MTTTVSAVAGAFDVRVVVSTDAAGADGIVLRRTMGGRSSVVRAWPTITGGAWAHTDIDVVFGVPIKYEAEIYDSGGTFLEASAVTAAVTVATDSAVMRDAVVLVNRAKIRFVGVGAGDAASDVRRELLHPLGRRAPVAVTDARSSYTGTAELLTLTRAEATQLVNLAAAGGVLVVTGPAEWDETWPLYVAVGKVQRSRVGASLSDARLWSVEWVEVDPPELLEPVPAVTWADLATAGETWQTLRQRSWLDVLYPAEAV